MLFNIKDTADVTFFLDGKQIGNVQTIDLSNLAEQTKEKQIKDGDTVMLFNREYSMTLENVEVDPNFINKLLPTNQLYTLVGTSIKYPRGNNLPKKKRIRNKWIKKYHKQFELENCRFL